jgi:hypothetical protein
MLRYLLLTLLLLPALAPACAVPVFRYALERWEGDPFQLVVFHRGALEASLNQAVHELEPKMEDRQGMQINWRVVHVDVSKPVSPLWADLWQSVAHAPLPHAAICTPEWRKGDAPLWKGALTRDAIDNMADSKARRAVAAELLKGTAVVWLVGESEDPAANAAMLKRIEAASERLKNEIVLPEGIGQDGVNVLSSLPLTVSFAVVKWRLSDPAEALLTSMVREEGQQGPILCPVFGRGRVLAAMPAATVDDGLLTETARFLCGACSCQVKAQNPGFDLLLKANWSQIFGDSEAPPLEPQAGEKKPVYVPIPTRKKSN